MAHDNGASRRIGKAAVNKVRAFFGANDLILNKIDQEDDIGIDAAVTLARTGLLYFAPVIQRLVPARTPSSPS